MKESFKEKYVSPEIKVTAVGNDIITFSEGDENDWNGPIIRAGFADGDNLS